MKELYYPTIKIEIDKWLKYSLLYKKELFTIKPTAYTNYDYSYLNNRIGEEFLKPYDPYHLLKIDFKTSLSFEKLMISYLRNISDYEEEYLILPSKKITLHKVLKSSTKSSVIFKGKCTPEIENFLIEKDYGEKIENNMHVSQRFATIYMGLLAEHISRIDNSIILTSKPNNINAYMNNIKILKQGNIGLHISPSNYNKKELFYQHVVQQFVPNNIDEMSVEEIAKVRTNSYLKELDNFYLLMDKLYFQGFNNENNVEDILKEINDNMKNLRGLMNAKFIRASISTCISAVIGTTPLNFAMSESVSHLIDWGLDSFSQGIEYSRPERKSTMKILTTLDSLNKSI